MTWTKFFIFCFVAASAFWFSFYKEATWVVFAFDAVCLIMVEHDRKNN